MAIAACLTLAMIHLQIAMRMDGRPRLAHFFFAEAGIFTPASAVEAATVNARDMASRAASRRINFKMLPLRESICGGLP